MSTSKAAPWAIGAVLVLFGVVLVVPLLLGTLFSALIEDQEQQSGTCQAVLASNVEAVGVPEQWQEPVADAAQEAGVPQEVIAAQLSAESGWDPGAVSPAGAVGLAQFMPGTWELYGQGDPRDPLASIAAQGEYMGALMDLAGEHTEDPGEQVRLALAAYNWGDGNMGTNGWSLEGLPEETTVYIDRILGGAQTEFSEACAPVAGQYDGDLGDGEWATPLPGGALTGGGAFGGRNVPGLPAWAQNHVGLDLATPGGDGQIVAPFPMRVTGIYDPDGCVLARQIGEPGFGVALCHMDDWSAKVGMEYERGDVVGSEGSRAASVGVGVIEHLHLELYEPGHGDPQYPGPDAPGVIDPTDIMRAKGAL